MDTRNHGKDRGKPWNKNKYVVNDGVVNILKLKESTFNLSNAIYAAKQQEAAKSQNVSRPQQTDKPKKYTQQRVYTKLAKPYDVVLKTLVANNLLMLPPPCPSEVVIKPSWWREDHFCEYH